MRSMDFSVTSTRAVSLIGLGCFVVSMIVCLRSFAGIGQSSAAVGNGREDIASLQLALPMILLTPSLILILPILQEYLWLPTWLRTFSILTYSVILPAQILGSYLAFVWVAKHHSSSMADFLYESVYGGWPSFWQLFLSSLVLITLVLWLGLVTGCISGKRTKQTEPPGGGKMRLLPSTRLYVVGGYTLIVIVFTHMLYSATIGAGANNLEVLANYGLSYPICLGLGILSILIGFLQSSLEIPKSLGVISGIIYLFGACTFWGAYHYSISDPRVPFYRPFLIAGLIPLMVSQIPLIVRLLLGCKTIASQEQ